MAWLRKSIVRSNVNSSSALVLQGTDESHAAAATTGAAGTSVGFDVSSGTADSSALAWSSAAGFSRGSMATGAARMGGSSLTLLGNDSLFSLFVGFKRSVIRAEKRRVTLVFLAVSLFFR